MNVKQYTDVFPDYFGIMLAIAYAEVMDIGQIYFPPGKYMITDTIQISNISNMTLYGEGELIFDGFKQKQDTQIIRMVNCTNMMIEGIVFNGSKANCPVAKMPPKDGSWMSNDSVDQPRMYYASMAIQQSENLTIRNCTFKNAVTSSVYVDNTDHLNILNNRFSDSYMDAVYGIHVHNEKKPTNTHVKIIGNSIERIQYLPEKELISYPNARYGNGITVNAEDLVILNNTISDIDRNGIEPCYYRGKEIRVVGNSISNFGVDGIHAAAAEDSIILAENEISNAKGDGIYAGGLPASVASKDIVTCKNVIISNNVINEAGTNSAVTAGISLGREIENVKLIANLIKNASDHGILVRMAKNLTIEHNQIEAANLYGIYMAGAGNHWSNQVIISGNSLIMQSVPSRTSSRWGIVLDTSMGVIVEGNYFVNHGTYTIKYDGPMNDKNQKQVPYITRNVEI